jgi:hypothetical protein
VAARGAVEVEAASVAARGAGGGDVAARGAVGVPVGGAGAGGTGVAVLGAVTSVAARGTGRGAASGWKPGGTKGAGATRGANPGGTLGAGKLPAGERGVPMDGTKDPDSSKKSRLDEEIKFAKGKSASSNTTCRETMMRLVDRSRQ